MITIQQDMPDVSGIEQLIAKSSDKQIIVDIDSINSDIEALYNKGDTPLSKVDKKNIQTVIDYLYRLIEETHN